MPNAQIEWEAVNHMIAGTNAPEKLVYSDEELGRAFRSYVLESQHNSWDGFSTRDVLGVRHMLFDMSLYTKCLIKGD